MKNLVVGTLTSLLFGILTLGPAAQAQRAGRAIQAEIPFEFTVGDQVFPAGTYSLVTAAPALLDLRDAEGHTLTRVLTNSVETLKTPTSPTLQFKNDGGRYSLAQVWQENYSVGQELPLPKSRVKTAKRHSGGTQTVAARNSQ
jgi:hypothetical protein